MKENVVTNNEKDDTAISVQFEKENVRIKAIGSQMEGRAFDSQQKVESSDDLNEHFGNAVKRISWNW